MNINQHKEKLIARLKDKEHREAFISANIQIGIPFQIRALREQRGWTQKELADHAGKKQAWIAQIENPNYAGFSLKTLLKLASAFDIGLIVKFVAISDLVKWELELSPESLEVQSFEEEDFFKPPVTKIVAQGGVMVGGEGISKFINPSQTIQAKPVDFVKYREAKQRELKDLKSPLQKLMGMER